MTNTAPELEEPKFKILNLATLRASAEEVLGYKPKKRKIREAYDEVLAHLKEEGKDLGYLCGRCKAPIDDEMEKCWACGSVIDDGEDPEVEADELAERAKRLGIDSDGKDRTELVSEIEAEETKRRAKSRDVDLSGIEAQRLNELMTAELPDGWRKSKARQYYSYFDPSGVRRIAVFHRGLRICFTVDDGLLDDFDDLEFLDAAERKRRHFGRANYQFLGDVAKNALEICRRVFKRYSDGG